MKRICLLGAAGTGKTRLAHELRAQFDGQRYSFDELQPGDAAAASGYDATLVLGLDLPSAAAASPADAQLRAALQQAGVPYQVVYGLGPQRLESARSALAARGIGAARQDPAAGRKWNWLCERCSDPECEHALFRGLK